MRITTHGAPLLSALCLFFIMGIASHQVDAADDGSDRYSPYPVKPGDAPSFANPSDFFSYFYRMEDSGPWVLWAGSDLPRCVAGLGIVPGLKGEPLDAVRMLALSGHEMIMSCRAFSSELDAKRALQQVVERFNADEIKRATAVRGGSDSDLRPFTYHSLVQAFLKHAPEDAIEDARWTQMTEQEIKLAQGRAHQRQHTGGQGPPYDWVFPPDSLQGRHVGLASSELMAEFKREVLKRAKATPDRFMLHIMMANLRYDRASETLLFGARSQPGMPFNVLQYSKAGQYQGYDIFGLNRNHGVWPAAAAPDRIAGTRGLSSRQSAIVIRPDRTLLLDPIQMPQERAEQLLNKVQHILVNVQLKVTGAAPDRSRPFREGVLFVELERVFVTDPAGDVLATYDLAALPVASAEQEAPSHPVCRSYQKRLDQETRRGDPKRIEYIRNLGAQHGCT